MNEELKNATEMAKDPSSYSAVTYLWVVLLAVWGGVVRAIRESLFEGKSWKEILRIVLFEMLASGFVGVITFYLCEHAGFAPLYTAAMTAISGYMGGRSLAVFEAILKKRLP